MSCLLAGCGRTPSSKLRGPLVRVMQAGNEAKMPSLDVLSPYMSEELGAQAPRWVLQVDVPVPLMQEKTVHESQSSGCGAAPGHFGHTVATLAAEEFPPGGDEVELDW